MERFNVTISNKIFFCSTDIAAVTRLNAVASLFTQRYKLSFNNLCYTSQLKYILRLEMCQVSRIGQNSLTSQRKNDLNESHVIRSYTRETAENLHANRVKQITFTQSWQLNGFKQELKKKLKSFYATKARNLLTKFSTKF